jgi:hypothetical protein
MDTWVASAFYLIADGAALNMGVHTPFPNPLQASCRAPPALPSLPISWCDHCQTGVPSLPPPSFPSYPCVSILLFIYLFIYLFILQYQGLNSGPHACCSGTVPLLCWIFLRQALKNCLPGLAWNSDPPDLGLLSSQDYRCEPPIPGPLCFLFRVEISRGAVLKAMQWSVSRSWPGTFASTEGLTDMITFRPHFPHCSLPQPSSLFWGSNPGLRHTKTHALSLNLASHPPILF